MFGAHSTVPDGILGPPDGTVEMAPAEHGRSGAHVFVLSNAGKPIFSTAGAEADLSSLSAVIQALVSFVRGKGDSDELQWVEGGGRRFVFEVREPLYLVAVTDSREHPACAARLLHYVHLQILFVLTASFDKVFRADASYDLRSLLGGTDKGLRSLICAARTRPDVLLEAVACVPLPPGTRAEFGRVLQLVEANLLFALLTVRGKVVSVVETCRRPLGASDLILLNNLLLSSQSLRAADESWVPVCLPGLDSRAFVHAHVSFVDPASDLCLVLITPRADDFERLAAARQQVMQRLSPATRDALRQAVEANLAEVDVGTLGIPALSHFVCLDRVAGVYVCARFPGSGGAAPGGAVLATTGSSDAPGATAEPAPNGSGESGESGNADSGDSAGEAGEPLLEVYQRLHAELHATSPPLSLLFVADGRHALLGLVTDEYELYTAHGPLCTKAEASAAAQALLRWVQRQRSTLVLEKHLNWA